MEKILVIDDSAFEIKVLTDILSDRYEIIFEKGGIEGIEAAQREYPMLILLDIIMPGMDGFEILNILKNDEKTMNIPIIFLTALEDEQTEERGLMKGAVDYIKKPYNPNIVRARVATQVKMYRYRCTIEALMAMDGLTNVHNRNDFEVSKLRFWECAQKEQRPISFLYIDVDYFKKVNDTFGHAIGDVVLSGVAEIIKHGLKESDYHYVARYGGDEFIAILYGESKEEAVLIAEQIRSSVEEFKMMNGNESVTVTVSLGGVTVIPQVSELPEPFIEQADNSLYRSKERGRNCVEWL